MNLRIQHILFLLGACLPLAPALSSEVIDADPDVDLVAASRDYKFIIGVGSGIVRFDVQATLTDKRRNTDLFVDLEGNFGLDERSDIRTLYGTYKFNSNHSLLFAYFDVSRRSRFDLSETYDEILGASASLEIRDDSRFYYVNYGYTLFLENNNKITLIAGLHGLDLRFSAEGRGDFTFDGETESERVIENADVFAPLPLIGLNFRTSYTPEWDLSTRVALVGGSYEDVEAEVFQGLVFSRYQFSRHAGLLLGLAYFSAEVDIEDSEELTEISYAYDGAFIGLHFRPLFSYNELVGE
jgi:hypothetical protein